MAKRGMVLSVVGVLIVGLVFLMGACGGGGSSPQADGQVELSGTITESGSTSVKPLVERMAAAFMNEHGKVRIEIGGGGSGKGISDCAAGISDIGAISRPVHLSESDLISYPIARDAVAIVVNESNTIEALSREEVAEIYIGEITEWGELGWSEGGSITPYCREKGSGTMDCFVDKVIEYAGYEEDEIVKEAERVDSNAGIQSNIQGDSSGIGFVSLGYVQGVKALKLEGIECTVENCLSGEYPVLRRLQLVTKTCPEQPAKAFIDFCRGPEGQQIAEEIGYVPLNVSTMCR
ncbi:MAG: phosphate ABC transporter substrate-binding protein [Dehalococcoidia bacterium]